MTPPTISVIICAYTEKRWDDLIASVESIKAQTVQPIEIIIVIDHNQSLFERAKIALQGQLVIENKQEKGLSGARNTGIASAKAEIIAFMDEDAIANPNWLECISEPYQDANVMGVGGVISPLWQSSKPAWFPEEFNWVVGCTYVGLSEERAPIRNLIGCNMSLRKEVFDAVGGFRSGIGRIDTLPYGCEETELCIRANQQFPDRAFIYEPLARVTHRVPDQRGSFNYYWSRCYAEGISKALITQLIGGRDGLSSERTYTFVTLPKGIGRGVLDAIRYWDWSGLGRASAILIGFGCTAWGYLIKKIALLTHQDVSTYSQVAS